MTKNRILFLVGLMLLVSFSSCGIFSKGCGCPTFGGIKTPATSKGEKAYIALALTLSNEKSF